MKVVEIISLKELPYATYTARLLKSEKDIKPQDTGYLYKCTEGPKMIILFTEFIEEIYGKVITETSKPV